MNYTLMDEEYNDSSYLYENKNKVSKKNIIIWGIIILLLLIVLLYLIINYFFNNSEDYSYIEKKMVDAAIKYVKTNNLNNTNSMYISINKLSDISLDDNCSNLSGVVVEGNSYYPYLICGDYKSDVINNQEEYAKLNGDEVVIIDINYQYHDLGCTSNYEVETISNYVNREGVYTYLYNIKNDNKNIETLRRKVIVIDNDENNEIKPQIKLNGDEIIYLNKGDTYQELGALATDKIDGDISNKVIINSNINSNVVGEYEVKYTVTNSKGYSSIIVRKVIVGEQKDDKELVVNNIVSPVEITNTDVRIIIMIIGDNYKHTVLPDGTINTNSTIEYSAKDNNTYNFLVYDNNDKVITKQIEVNNIDKKVPTGVCNAITYKDYTDVTIKNVSEESCVYNYETNSYSSVYMNQDTYRMPIGELENVSVNVKDLAGNIGKINCTVEKDLSVINKEYINEKGYNCIEPYTCLKQGDYWRTEYCYYSTETCGPINKRGCSITSVATVLSKWDKRSKNGELYTPYTLMDEVYGSCSHCSGTTQTRKVFEKLGLQVVRNPENNKDWFSLNMKNYDILLNHLKTGNPAVIRVSHENGGWYTDGGHIMSLLTANSEGLVYLYDTGTKIGTKNSWGHAVNTFVPLEDVINHCGKNCTFQLIKE